MTNGTILQTGEWQLLLGAIALPGVFLGALLSNRVGRKNIMMIGFSGYLIFGLIIGCAYMPMTRIVPLFVVFDGPMQSSGNFGPGNVFGLLFSEPYGTGVRGTCYGLRLQLVKLARQLVHRRSSLLRTDWVRIGRLSSLLSVP